MGDLVVRTALAGVMFGLWPLIMQRSGLEGNVSSVIFAGVACLVVLPFAVNSGIVASIHSAPLPLLGVVAGVVGAIGLLFLNSMIQKVTVDRIGSMIAIMTLIQLMTPVVYQAVTSGHISLRHIAGAVTAVAAIYLLKPGS